MLRFRHPLASPPAPVPDRDYSMPGVRANGPPATDGAEYVCIGHAALRLLTSMRRRNTHRSRRDAASPRPLARPVRAGHTPRTGRGRPSVRKEPA